MARFAPYRGARRASPARWPRRAARPRPRHAAPLPLRGLGALLLAMVALLVMPLAADFVATGARPSLIAEATRLLALMPQEMSSGRGASRAGFDHCRITRVVDGDTVRARCGAGAEDRVRLMGFDTPEVFSPGCAAEKARGDAATQALRAMIAEAGRIDFAFQGRDRYDRRLAVLRLDGRDVAGRMIDAGHARPYGGGRRDGWCGGG